MFGPPSLIKFVKGFVCPAPMRWPVYPRRCLEAPISTPGVYNPSLQNTPPCLKSPLICRPFGSLVCFAAIACGPPANVVKITRV